jgi:hypothetical protein
MATAPQFHQSSTNISNEPTDPSLKISRNKKKKLRKKQKRIQTLIEHQEKQIEFIQRENLTLLCTKQEDENKRLSKFLEFSESTTTLADLTAELTNPIENEKPDKKPEQKTPVVSNNAKANDEVPNVQNTASLNKNQKRRLKAKAKKQLLKQQQNGDSTPKPVEAEKQIEQAKTAQAASSVQQATNSFPGHVNDTFDSNEHSYNPVTDPCRDENDLQVKIADLGN